MFLQPPINDCIISENKPSQVVRAKELKFLENVHLPPSVTYHMSHFIFSYFFFLFWYYSFTICIHYMPSLYAFTICIYGTVLPVTKVAQSWVI